MTSKRSDIYRTPAKSCDINKYDRLNSFLSPTKRSSMRSCIETSRADTGSSQMSSSGCNNRARAMEIGRAACRERVEEVVGEVAGKGQGAERHEEHVDV